MADMTNALEKEICDGLTGVTQYTSPATVYLALFTADPTETGSVANEVSGTNYARVSLSGKFSASTDGSASNTAPITFATAGAGGWGTVTHVGLMKSGTASTDDMILYKALQAGPITILENEIFQFLTGNLTITIA